MKKISRRDKIKEDIVNEIGVRNKNRYKKVEFKLNDSKNDLNRY